MTTDGTPVSSGREYRGALALDLKIQVSLVLINLYNILLGRDCNKAKQAPHDPRVVISVGSECFGHKLGPGGGVPGQDHGLDLSLPTLLCRMGTLPL